MKYHRTRRWLGAKQVAVVAAVALIGGLAMAGSASAVHDLSFQLEGDVNASTTTFVGGNTQTIDWSSLFNADGSKKALPSGFTASVFTKDFNTNTNGSFNTSDATTYTTGSKDTLPIATGWQCTASNNVNSKVDIMNSYATAYTAGNGHQILYFGLERNTNTGDGNVAFWFLQNAVGCNANGGTGSFTGDHADGDLLIVSAFTNGGAVSGVDVYRWNGGANGTLGTTPVAHGVDCKITGGGDDACATVNGTTNGTNGTITTPWPTANTKDGVGNSLRTSEFFEGGLDLTAKGLGGKCFNSFTGDTRSSQSLTATLFDYSLGNLGECASTTTTVPTPTGSATIIPASGTQTTSDSATVTVTGISTFSGSLTFHLCGPFTLASTTTCTTGGAAIGSAQTITASGTYGSDTATVTAAGRYCWRADFSGDTTAGVPASSDGGPASECFALNPRQSTLVTHAGAGPVAFGNAVTDTATIGNTANQPGSGGLGDGSINPTTAGAKAGGTVSFTLYKDNCTTVASPYTGETGTFPLTRTVDGDGTYGPVSFKPDAPGTYHWVATYSGNLPNTLASLASASVCGSDPNEDVVVQQIDTQISTAQSAYPNDSATVTSAAAGDNLPAGGTVVFRLYGPTSGKTALENCTAASAVINTGGLIYTESKTVVGGAHFETKATANTSVSVNASDTYYWSVTYATGDTAHTGRQSSCAENTVLTFHNDAGPGTLFP